MTTRWSLCLVSLLGACTASTSAGQEPVVGPAHATTPSPPTAASATPPIASEPLPGTEAPPAPTPTPAPAPAPAPSATPEIWRFTTLVTGGPEPLVGANGYYELELDGDQATVRKVGERGTPELPAARVMTGTGTLALAEDGQWPTARTGTVSVVLTSASATLPMTLSVWMLGDELHGTWAHPSRKAAAPLGRAWGLLQGTRGRGAPAALVDGEQAPCSVCHQAFFVCEGMGSAACNSSNDAIATCDARMKAARAKAAAVPRGCGDWMHHR